jgi:tetratricopeptide (TPR) repeat protein
MLNIWVKPMIKKQWLIKLIFVSLISFNVLLFPQQTVEFPQELTADQLYEEGVKLYKQEKYQEALPCFQEATRRKANFAEAHFQLGLCHLKVSEFTKAKEQFYFARIFTNDEGMKDISLAFMNKILRFEKGIKSFKEGKYQQAHKYFTDSAEGEQGLKEGYYHAALCFVRLIDVENAKKWLSLAKEHIANEELQKQTTWLLGNLSSEIENEKEKQAREMINKIDEAEKAEEERQRKIAADFPGFRWGTHKEKIVPEGTTMSIYNEWIKIKKEHGIRTWNTYLFNEENQLVGGRIIYRVLGEFNDDSKFKLDVPEFAKKYIRDRDRYKQETIPRDATQEEVAANYRWTSKEYMLRSIAYISAKLFETKEKELENLYGDPIEKRKSLKTVPQNIKKLHGGLGAPKSYIMDKWESEKTIIFLLYSFPGDVDVERSGVYWGSLHWHVQIFYYSKLFLSSV